MRSPRSSIRSLGDLAALAAQQVAHRAQQRRSVLPAPLPPSSATTPPSGTCGETPANFFARITWL